MNNTGLLAIIAVILLGILTISLIQANEKSPTEKIGDSISETVEEVGDEIDDHTDAK